MSYPTNNWHELTAAAQSEKLLEEYERRWASDPDWQVGCTQQELEQAREDALRAIVRPQDLPDPRKVANDLVTAFPDAAWALMHAYKGQKPPYAGSWRVNDDENAQVLRSLGLVGWVSKHDGCSVGGFGMRVRKVLLSVDADFIEAEESDADS